MWTFKLVLLRIYFYPQPHECQMYTINRMQPCRKELITRSYEIITNACSDRTVKSEFSEWKCCLLHKSQDSTWFFPPPISPKCRPKWAQMNHTYNSLQLWLHCNPSWNLNQMLAENSLIIVLADGPLKLLLHLIATVWIQYVMNASVRTVLALTVPGVSYDSDGQNRGYSTFYSYHCMVRLPWFCWLGRRMNAQQHFSATS